MCFTVKQWIVAGFTILDQVYSVTTYNATSSGFGVNVQSLEDRKWDDEITVSHIVQLRMCDNALLAYSDTFLFRIYTR